MDTPTKYNNICKKALDAKDKLGLSDVQTLLYNHICRGDFKLRNEDGQKFYDKDNNGFGWSGSRDWVKKQLEPLMKAKLVAFKSLHDCGDRKYTSWYFYDPEFQLEDLIDASCYVSTSKLAMVKHYLKLPDGFEKQNVKHGDLELIHNENGYTFKYKGVPSIYDWDFNGEGKREDSEFWTPESPQYYESFQDMIHDIWSFLAHEGYEYISNIPGYTDKRWTNLSFYDGKK